jgi:hypothetical protein
VFQNPLAGQNSLRSRLSGDFGGLFSRAYLPLFSAETIAVFHRFTAAMPCDELLASSAVIQVATSAPSSIAYINNTGVYQ